MTSGTHKVEGGVSCVWRPSAFKTVLIAPSCVVVGMLFCRVASNGSGLVVVNVKHSLDCAFTCKFSLC